MLTFRISPCSVWTVYVIVWLPRQAELWTSLTPQLGAFFLPLVSRELCVFDNENDVNSFSVPQDKLALVTFIEWRSARGPLDNAVPMYLPILYVYNSLFCTFSKKKLICRDSATEFKTGKVLIQLKGQYFHWLVRRVFFKGQLILSSASQNIVH